LPPPANINAYIFIPIGLCAGVLSGLFGVGGGLVIVPSLIILAGFPILMATGTSLAVIMLPLGIFAVYEYYKHGNVNISAALWIAAGFIFGAWIGAWSAQRIDPLYLKRAFAVFLVVVAVKIWVGR
jgi:uncharacterized membrane protein YfcA